MLNVGSRVMCAIAYDIRGEIVTGFVEYVDRDEYLVQWDFDNWSEYRDAEVRYADSLMLAG